MTSATSLRRLLLVGVMAAGLASVPAAQDPQRPVRRPADPGVVTTRQAITPAGVQSVFDGRVYGVAWGADDTRLWVLTGRSLFELDWLGNLVRRRIDLPVTPGLQALGIDPASGRSLVAGAAHFGTCDVQRGERQWPSTQ